MAEDKTLPPHEPNAAAEAKAGGEEGGSQDIFKIAGGLVFLIASVGLCVHRMPHIGYVEKHTDKPKAVAAAAPMAMPKPAPKVAAAPAPAPAKPLPVTAKAPAPVKAAAAATNAAPEETAQAGEGPLEPEIDWQDACDGEIGLLCYGVPVQRQRTCLKPYHDALRKTCRKALKVASSY